MELSPRFEERLEELITFLLERAGAEPAKRTYAAILSATRSLDESPRRCRKVPELDVDFRVRDDVHAVDVLTLRHGRHPLDFAELGDD